MTIDWHALLLVAGVSLAFGVGVVTVFSSAWCRWPAAVRPARGTTG
nr:hypothetical protein [Angustibacter aerolatus]